MFFKRDEGKAVARFGLSLLAFPIALLATLLGCCTCVQEDETNLDDVVRHVVEE